MFTINIFQIFEDIISGVVHTSEDDSDTTGDTEVIPTASAVKRPRNNPDLLEHPTATSKKWKLVSENNSLSHTTAVVPSSMVDFQTNLD